MLHFINSYKQADQKLTNDDSWCIGLSVLWIVVTQNYESIYGCHHFIY